MMRRDIQRLTVSSSRRVTRALTDNEHSPRSSLLDLGESWSRAGRQPHQRDSRTAGAFTRRQTRLLTGSWSHSRRNLNKCSTALSSSGAPARAPGSRRDCEAGHVGARQHPREESARRRGDLDVELSCLIYELARRSCERRGSNDGLLQADATGARHRLPWCRPSCRQR